MLAAMACALGRPASDFLLQKSRNAWRCHAMTVSGLMMAPASAAIRGSAEGRRPRGLGPPRSKGKTGGPRPQEDAELMPQREVLGHECGPRAKEGDERPQEESNQAEHADRIRAENEPEEGGPGGAGPSLRS